MSDGWSIDHSSRAREAVLRNPWEWASAALIFLLLLFSSYLKSDVSKVAQPAVYDFLMAGTVALHVILRIRFPKELGWPVLLWLFLMLGYGLGALDALLPQRARDFMLVMSTSSSLSSFSRPWSMTIREGACPPSGGAMLARR